MHKRLACLREVRRQLGEEVLVEGQVGVAGLVEDVLVHVGRCRRRSSSTSRRSRRSERDCGSGSSESAKGATTRGQSAESRDGRRERVHLAGVSSPLTASTASEVADRLAELHTYSSSEFDLAAARKQWIAQFASAAAPRRDTLSVKPAGSDGARDEATALGPPSPSVSYQTVITCLLLGRSRFSSLSLFRAVCPAAAALLSTAHTLCAWAEEYSRASLPPCPRWSSCSLRARRRSSSPR